MLARASLLLLLAISGIAADVSPQQQNGFFGRAPDTLWTVPAYRLAASQAYWPNGSTDSLSWFWEAWRTCGALNVNIIGRADTSSTMTVRALYGDSGVYLLLETNDGFCCYSNFGSIWDSYELYLEGQPAAELYARADSVFWNPRICQLTYNFLHIEAGASPMPFLETLDFLYRIDCLSQAATVTPGVSAPNQVLEVQRFVSYENVSVVWGIHTRTPLVGINPSNSARPLEIFIPWRSWGTKGVSGSALQGLRMGFLFGYNDAYKNAASVPTYLRWRNSADPYTRAYNPATGDTESVDCWGDLLLAEPLDSAMIACGCEPLGPPPQSVENPLRRPWFATHVGGVDRQTQFTDIRGRHLPSAARPQGVYVSASSHGSSILRNVFLR